MNTIRSKPLRVLEVILVLAWWGLLASAIPILVFLFAGFMGSTAHFEWTTTAYAEGIDLSTLQAENRSGQPASVALAGEVIPVNLSLPVDEHNRWLALLSIGGVLAAVFGFSLLGIRLLRQILASIRRGDPFITENARRIRVLGALAMAGAVTVASVRGLVSLFVAKAYSTTGFRLVAVFELNWSVLLLGLAVLVLAEVFREGARIREEQSLTI